MATNGRAGGDECLCEIRDPNGLEDGVPEGEANARLIAAAPDLLAACKASLKFLDNTDGDHWPAALDRMLRAAINKAEGGAR